MRFGIIFMVCAAYLTFTDIFSPSCAKNRTEFNKTRPTNERIARIISDFTGVSENALPATQELQNILKSHAKYFLYKQKTGGNKSGIKNRTCSSRNSLLTGTCVDYKDVSNFCWDKDAEESPDCGRYNQVCCVERTEQTVDQGTCGSTRSVIRSPRQQRPANEAAAKEICWMASLVAVQITGDRTHICDAVIFNSTHVITPSECIIRVRDVIGLKKLVVSIGDSVSGLRQSQDFSLQRCGQELKVEEELSSISDTYLTVLVRKGYALLKVSESIISDRCTCRVCLPTKEEFLTLRGSLTCYSAGILTNFKKISKRSPPTEFLQAFATRLLSASMCETLLRPQKLPESQLLGITNKLLCGISPDISGYCTGGLGGGSLTCIRESDQQHVLIGLTIQPLDCYSAPRLFRNIVGCFNGINDTTTECLLPNILSAAAGENTCGRPKTNTSDPFSLQFQTPAGSLARHRNIGRRMQMLSGFPVSDAALLGRSGFASSEVSQPGLHVVQDTMVCWAVAVYNANKGHCSGVLLTPRHVLTAAHCVTEFNGTITLSPDIVSVFIGFDSIPRTKLRDCEGIFSVNKITVHPLYSKPSGNRFYDLNDIAVLELEIPVDVDNNPCVCTICLDSSKISPVPGELCTLSGFGCPAPIFATESCPAPRPWSLTWSNVIVLSDAVCSAIPHYSKEGMTCSVTDGGPSGCYGDSGGPLVCYNHVQHRHYLHGIFSFILSTNAASPQRCRMQPLNPNYYTKVSNYMPWLIEAVPGLMINENPTNGV